MLQPEIRQINVNSGVRAKAARPASRLTSSHVRTLSDDIQQCQFNLPVPIFLTSTFPVTAAVIRPVRYSRKRSITTSILATI